MTIEFNDEQGNYIKQWPNWSGVTPIKDDHVLLHFGDNNEKEVEYLVTGRGISGIEPDKVLLIIEEVAEEE